MLELIEDEARHHERAVDEPGLDDLGDPAVDDRGRIDDDARHPGTRLGTSVVGPPKEPDGLRGHDQVPSFGDGESEHAETEEQRDTERERVTPRRREVRERDAEQQPHEQTERQADDSRDELGRRQVFDARDQPRRRDERQIRQDREADDDPGDDPRRQQESGVAGVLEQPFAGRREHQPHEPAERSAQ